MLFSYYMSVISGPLIFFEDQNSIKWNVVDPLNVHMVSPITSYVSVSKLHFILNYF
jgi:hypothetical protein